MPTRNGASSAICSVAWNGSRRDRPGTQRSVSRGPVLIRAWSLRTKTPTSRGKYFPDRTGTGRHRKAAIIRDFLKGSVGLSVTAWGYAVLMSAIADIAAHFSPEDPVGPARVREDDRQKKKSAHAQ